VSWFITVLPSSSGTFLPPFLDNFYVQRCSEIKPYSKDRLTRISISLRRAAVISKFSLTGFPEREIKHSKLQFDSCSHDHRCRLA
jgi:hypothetical protein